MIKVLEKMISTKNCKGSHNVAIAGSLHRTIGLLQQTITWYMVEGKVIVIPALGHQNKGKSSFTGSGLFVLKGPSQPSCTACVSSEIGHFRCQSYSGIFTVVLSSRCIGCKKSSLEGIFIIES